MRIAHIANFYGPRSGGLRTAMQELGRGYIARGHEVLLVVPGARDALERTPCGTRVTIRAPRLPGSGGYRMITRIDRVRDALTRFAPDILEVSDRTTLRSTASWAAARDIPTVFFAHERSDGVLRAHVPRVATSPWAQRAIDSHNAGTYEAFTEVVCTTSYAAGEFARLGLPTRHVPLGVDLEHFHPGRADSAMRARYARPSEALLVMASRLSAEKRPDLAIEAVRILHRRGLPVRLVIAGSGPRERALRALSAGLPVEFAGFVSCPDTFAALLATADVLVAPGPIETFGLAALEALASGTPVVANSASALKEVMGEAGICARGTAGDLAMAIHGVLRRDPRNRSSAARSQAECWPWTRTIDAMEALHRSLALAPTARLAA
ncbi:glycosyltransferase [Demequina globuliformis]|uniref:glycosyltransferase n=1 Tax=Demequina globuliformis TaxID=676202 RepID=UPI00078435AC|nr:glycosyltransferase [Demequina globuliformis]